MFFVCFSFLSIFLSSFSFAAGSPLPQDIRMTPLGVEYVRTPAELTEGLVDFSWKSKFVSDLSGFEGLRMAYLDEGPKDADVFLFLHGEPEWSYSYRKMIPGVLERGYRVIAPDWFGFGRSDKPVEQATYTYSFHRNSMIELIRKLDLKNVTLVVQDWGGVLGLTIPMEMESRFKRLIIMNTALATGLIPIPKGFIEWRDWINSYEDPSVEDIMRRYAPGLSDEEYAGYAAPYPNVTFKAGVKRFPNLAPLRVWDEGAYLAIKAALWWRTKWKGESFMAIGAQDIVIPPYVMKILKATIRGCPEPLIIEEAGHFVQEHGEQVIAGAFEAFGE